MAGLESSQKWQGRFHTDSYEIFFAWVENAYVIIFWLMPHKDRTKSYNDETYGTICSLAHLQSQVTGILLHQQLILQSS